MKFKPLYVSLAWLGLVLTCAAPILYFLGFMSLDATQWLLLLGAVLWMIFAGLWIWPKRAVRH